MYSAVFGKKRIKYRSCLFAYRSIKRHCEFLVIEDRERSGRLSTVHTPTVVKAVKQRIRRNCCATQQFSPESVCPQQQCHTSSKTILGDLLAIF